MTDLKLIALDTEDLEIVSAHVQDAIIRTADMGYARRDRRFALLMNRFDWASDKPRSKGVRKRTALHFDGVTHAAFAGFDPSAPEGVLELFATRGLDQAAVHVTKLALGEGLVGTIAEDVEVLNLDEAASHPDFAYKPETGEDRFHSFAGVPIIRRERSVGVLAVQHTDRRKYADVEIEALQTVAMVLSELIANAGLIDTTGGGADRPQSTAAMRIPGQKLVDGMGAGFAVYHQPRITIEHTVAEDTDAERHREAAQQDAALAAGGRLRGRLRGWAAIAHAGRASAGVV